MRPIVKKLYEILKLGEIVDVKYASYNGFDAVIANIFQNSKEIFPSTSARFSFLKIEKGEFLIDIRLSGSLIPTDASFGALLEAANQYNTKSVFPFDGFTAYVNSAGSGKNAKPSIELKRSDWMKEKNIEDLKADLKVGEIAYLTLAKICFEVVYGESVKKLISKEMKGKNKFDMQALRMLTLKLQETYQRK